MSSRDTNANVFSYKTPEVSDVFAAKPSTKMRATPSHQQDHDDINHQFNLTKNLAALVGIGFESTVAFKEQRCLSISVICCARIWEEEIIHAGISCLASMVGRCRQCSLGVIYSAPGPGFCDTAKKSLSPTGLGDLYEDSTDDENAVVVHGSRRGL